jgi:hypothetical protein
MDKAMTEAANIERQKRRQAEFVNDEQQRLLEIEDMRPPELRTVIFGHTSGMIRIGLLTPV